MGEVNNVILLESQDQFLTWVSIDFNQLSILHLWSSTPKYL